LCGAENDGKECTGPGGRHPQPLPYWFRTKPGPPNQCAHEHESRLCPRLPGCSQDSWVGSPNRQGSQANVMGIKPGRGRLRLRPLLELKGEEVRNEPREGAVGEGAEQVSPRNSVRRGLVRIIQSYRSPKPPWNLSLKWCRIGAGDDACWSPSWCSSLPLRPGSSFSLIVSSE
jgi:hypothetical protein